ncbi:MAG: nitroreductase family protein [Syntrophaceae bacterium]|nr:nitroreductase family protein [Syntrophaceae bacterium]
MSGDKPITFDELVAHRRSIRKYKPDIPSDDLIESMVHAALVAPSPSNTQPIRFIRLKSPHYRRQIRDGMAKVQERLMQIAADAGRPKWMKNRIKFYNRYMAFIFDAPVLMAVVTVRPKELLMGPEILFGKKLEDIRVMNLHMTAGLSVMNYLLKGEDLGLGSCIMSAPLIFLDDAEKMLGLEDMEPICFITSGYPDETPKPIKRKTIEEIYWCK